MDMKIDPVDPAKPPELPPEACNDSTMSPEQGRSVIAEDGISITYGDLTIAVPRAALDEVREHIATWNREEKQRAMLSVDRALRAALPTVRKGTASKRRMDNFYSDLLLWTVLSEASAA